MVSSSIQRTVDAVWRVAFALAVAASSALGVSAQDFVLNEQTFNQWLYSSSQGHFDPETELTLTLEAVDRACTLTEPQKQKLQLAGRGDFSRFERRVAELREQYVGKKFSQDEIGEVYQKILPLGEIYQEGLLGDSSLFTKVLEKNLTEEQTEKCERMETERRRARHAAKVRLFVAGLQQSCALTDKQRTELVEILLAETKPPKRFSQYDWYVILYQAGKVADEKYEHILDAAQVKPLKRTLQQGAGMEQWLKQQKLIEE